MKPRYLSHGFWHVSKAVALRVAQQYADGARLPKSGYETLGKVCSHLVWVARTPHNGKMVWSIRAAFSGNDVEFRRCMEEIKK